MRLPLVAQHQIRSPAMTTMLTAGAGVLSRHSALPGLPCRPPARQAAPASRRAGRAVRVAAIAAPLAAPEALPSRYAAPAVDEVRCLGVWCRQAPYRGVELARVSPSCRLRLAGSAGHGQAGGAGRPGGTRRHCSWVFLHACATLFSGGTEGDIGAGLCPGHALAV